MSQPRVLLDLREGNYWLTLNRPEVLNAFDEHTLRELFDTLRSIADPARPLIFTGAGRAFSTGGDLKSYFAKLDDPESLRSYFHVLAEVFETIASYPSVTVAAVNGFAVAGGLELLCVCDLAVASESARFADGHINYGLHPAAGASVLLARIIGERRARWLLLSGEFIDSAEALRIGLVNRVVPDTELQFTANSMAAAVARHSPAAVQRTKRLLKTDIQEILRIERDSILAHFQHPETRLRLAQFAARTPAD